MLQKVESKVKKMTIKITSLDTKNKNFAKIFSDKTRINKSLNSSNVFFKVLSINKKPHKKIIWLYTKK